MRIQLDFDEAGVRAVNELKKRTGLKTYKDLFNNALSILDWATRQVADGRLVASLDERNENYRELQMPVLMNARDRAAESSPERELPGEAATAS